MSEKKLPAVGDSSELGSMEGPVFRHLALLNRKRWLENEYRKVKKAIDANKQDPQLMTIVGNIQRAQSKRDQPSSEDEKETETAGSSPKKRKNNPARQQLEQRIKNSDPKPVDKSLQTGKS